MGEGEEDQGRRLPDSVFYGTLAQIALFYVDINVRAPEPCWMNPAF
jgi:hypothetical protein